jgi:DNA-binding CsgD family transcriptional regulator
LAEVVRSHGYGAALGIARGVGYGAVDFAADYGLTPREAETAALIALGMSYKEAAYELGITTRTVKAHMSSVYEKTGAASNVALALLMRDGKAALDKSPMAGKPET